MHTYGNEKWVGSCCRAVRMRRSPPPAVVNQPLCVWHKRRYTSHVLSYPSRVPYLYTAISRESIHSGTRQPNRTNPLHIGRVPKLCSRTTGSCVPCILRPTTTEEGECCCAMHVLAAAAVTQSGLRIPCQLSWAEGRVRRQPASNHPGFTHSLNHLFVNVCASVSSCTRRDSFKGNTHSSTHIIGGDAIRCGQIDRWWWWPGRLQPFPINSESLVPVSVIPGPVVVPSWSPSQRSLSTFIFIYTWPVLPTTDSAKCLNS